MYTQFVSACIIATAPDVWRPGRESERDYEKAACPTYMALGDARFISFVRQRAHLRQASIRRLSKRSTDDFGTADTRTSSTSNRNDLPFSFRFYIFRFETKSICPDLSSILFRPIWFQLNSCHSNTCRRRGSIVIPLSTRAIVHQDETWFICSFFLRFHSWRMASADACLDIAHLSVCERRELKFQLKCLNAQPTLITCVIDLCARTGSYAFEQYGKPFYDRVSLEQLMNECVMNAVGTRGNTPLSTSRDYCIRTWVRPIHVTGWRSCASAGCVCGCYAENDFSLIHHPSKFKVKRN